MKILTLKAALYAIELPLIVCLILGFILLVALHFIAPEHEEEGEGLPRMPKQPKDSLWQL